jgi:hypothetical protein
MVELEADSTTLSFLLLVFSLTMSFCLVSLLHGDARLLFLTSQHHNKHLLLSCTCISNSFSTMDAPPPNFLSLFHAMESQRQQQK